MSTNLILIYAISVFTLMIIGIILTMIEFRRLSDDPSVHKGSEPARENEQQTQRKGNPDMRVVHSKDNAA